MKEIIVPRARLLECSATIRDNMELHKITLEKDPEAVRALGGILLEHYLPELGLLLRRDVLVATDGAVQMHQGERTPFTSAEFKGRFSEIRISDIEKPEYIEDFGVMTTEWTDVVFVFQQKITEADPVDLGYSDEILVPMSDMDSIRRGAAA